MNEPVGEFEEWHIRSKRAYLNPDDLQAQYDFLEWVVTNLPSAAREYLKKNNIHEVLRRGSEAMMGLPGTLGGIARNIEAIWLNGPTGRLLLDVIEEVTRREEAERQDALLRSQFEHNMKYAPPAWVEQHRGMSFEDYKRGQGVA